MKKNNAHMHFMTKFQVPDNYFQTRIPGLNEWYLERYTTLIISYLQIPFTNSKKLPEMIKLYKMKLNEQAKYYVDEMDKAEIQSSIVLMMDMAQSSFGDLPEWSYPYQIIAMLEIAEKYPERFYILPMVDPRRNGIYELIINAFENSNYVKGIKLYPNLGYSPDPYDGYNLPEVNSELEDIYRFFDIHNSVVISHCSKGGAYSSKTMRSEEERHWLSHPLRYRMPLQKFPNIKFCLAHFGGDFHELQCNSSDDKQLMISDAIKYKNSWSAHIISMMNDFLNLWTDIAYNDKLVLSDETAFIWAKNLWNLPNYMYDRMLYGDDWLMMAHLKSSKEWSEIIEKNLLKYVPSYRKQTCLQILEQLFYRNFFEFLGIKEIG